MISEIFDLAPVYKDTDQKAIIASGFSESEDVLMAQNMGAGSFIKKTYTLLDMGIAIKEELER